eukprot:6293307-Pyramimonas_sp.AAC.1
MKSRRSVRVLVSRSTTVEVRQRLVGGLVSAGLCLSRPLTRSHAPPTRCNGPAPPHGGIRDSVRPCRPLSARSARQHVAPPLAHRVRQ